MRWLKVQRYVDNHMEEVKIPNVEQGKRKNVWW